MTTSNNHLVVQPYLFFNGRCEEALNFYRSAVGAEVAVVSRFKDAPPQSGMCSPAPNLGDKVMHATFRIGETTLMASDGQCSGTGSFEGISLSINVPTVADAERILTALSNGGKVHMPITKTFFSPGFGMVQDKFGVSWMIHAAPAAQG